MCRPLRARRAKPLLSGSLSFPCVAMDTTDNDESSDDSLEDALSRIMGSHSDTHIVDFCEHDFYISPPPHWDFMTNDESWHSLWYTPEELKAQGICYSTTDRELPFLAGHKALFRAKTLSIECNTQNPLRPATSGQEFWWPVVCLEGQESLPLQRPHCQR